MSLPSDLTKLLDNQNGNTFYQPAISPKTSQKAREVLNALQKIANGSEEETVRNLRDDLEQYGGTNDITFIYGNHKKGIQHIAEKHGTKTLIKVFDTVIDGDVLRYVSNKKTVILSKGNYEAVLSLDENGKKKTWLLSGWNTKEKSSDVSSEVSTQSTTTQIKPTFSRQDLGAELSNSITYLNQQLNPSAKNYYQEEQIGKALYVINKNAKKIRDVRNNLKDFLFDKDHYTELEEETLEALRKQYPDVVFDSEKGAVYVDDYGEMFDKYALDKYIYELKDNSYLLSDRLEEAKENNENTEELEDEYDLNKSELAYAEENFEKLNEVNLYDFLSDLLLKQRNLYDLKKEILTLFEHKKQGQHRFKDGTARNLYEIGSFSFHGEDISDSLSQEEYENLELLDTISSEIKLSDNEKISLENAKNILNDFLEDNQNGNTSDIEDVTNPLAYDYINFKNSNEKIEIKINPDLMGRDNESVEPIEINAYNVKSETNFKNNIANEIKINLFGTTGKNIQSIKATNKKTGQTVDINGRTINESTKELLKGTEKNLVASILLNSKNIFENSELILINDEAKNENLKNKQNVYRYATQIKYNNEKYIVISTVFDNKEKTQISIYHIAGYKNSVTDKHQKMSGDNTNISISQLRDFVKSKLVKQYNNDYKIASEKLNVLKQSEYDNYKENERRQNYEKFNRKNQMPYSYEAIADKLKKLWDEWNNTPLFEENEELNTSEKIPQRVDKLHELTEQIEILEDYFKNGKNPDAVIKIMSDDGNYETKQNNLFTSSSKERFENNQSHITAEPYTGYRGRTVIDKNLILIGATGDVTTVLHEYAHWYLNWLEMNEGVNEKIDAELSTVRKYLKNDGSRFSRKQHEKFAKAFENYIYSGRAKNSKLRAIYEDIKNILHHIYEVIQRGEYFLEGENPLTKEELENSKAVFDEIFKLEQNNLQERVFKKVDKLKADIAEIKKNQKQEIAEIRAVRDNIQDDFKEQGEIKKTKEILKSNADKYAEKKENKKWEKYNKDRQDTAWSILANALGMKVSEVKRKLHSKHEKTREDIELKLREVGDKLSAGDFALNENVIEYFGKIDMTDTDASQQLVNMALNAIDTKVNLDTELNRAINVFLNKFEYFKKQYINTPQKNGMQRSVIIDVIGELMDELNLSSLPSVFIEDFATEMQELTKDFEDTNQSRAGRIDNSYYRSFILAKLKNVKLYDPETKRKGKISPLHSLYAKLPAANNAVNAEKLIREINSALIDDIEMKIKSIIAKEIAIQLRVNSRVIRTKSNIQKGLYDWRTNQVWLDLQKLNAMSIPELTAELERTVPDAIKELYCLDKAEDAFKSVKENTSTVDWKFENNMRKKFIQYKMAKNLKDANSSLMLDLLSDIMEYKNKARQAKSEEELSKLLERYDLRNDLAERILKNPKKIKQVIKYLFENDSLENWNTVLRVCFGNDVAEKYSILDEEIEKEIYENNILINFYKHALQNYGIKNEGKFNGVKKLLIDPRGISELQKMFREYENEENTWTADETIYDFKTKEATPKRIILNRAQIITMYAWYQNELLKKRLINQFGGEYTGEIVLKGLFSHLSEEDKQFAFILMDTCDAMYDDINEVMIRSQGLSLVREPFYIPSIVRRRGDVIDNVFLVNSRIGYPSSIKARVKSQNVAMLPINPLTILSSHIDTMASYVCVSEKASFISQIFGSPDLQRAFENAFDPQYLEMIDKIGGYDSINPLSYKYINHTKNKDIKVGIKINPDLSERKNEEVKALKIENNLNLTNNRGDNKRIVKEHIFKNSPDKKIIATNKNTGDSVVINASSVDESLSKIKETSDTEKINIIADFKNIFEKSELICHYRDVKSDIDLNSSESPKRIYRYAALVESEKNKYVCITTVKEGENDKKEAFLKAYNLESLDLKRHGIETMKPLNAESLHDTANIIISDLVNIIKARLVERYNEDYKEAIRKFKEKNIDLKNLKLKKKKSTKGAVYYRLLVEQMAASTFFKYSQTVRTMGDLARTLISNFTVQAIGMSPKIAAAQVLSVINYADGSDITFVEWTKEFAYCMAHPKETIEFMKKDGYLQARFKGNLQNETMQSILEKFDRWKGVKTFVTSNVRLGDMFTIMFGGRAYINHLMKNKNMTEEEAFKRFRRKTNETQQSSLPSTISNYQRTSRYNALNALFLAFTNTPHQYERKALEAVADFIRANEIKDKKERARVKKVAVKIFLIYRILSPILFDFILQNLGAYLIMGALGGDPDKGKLAGIAFWNSLLLGNYAGYGLKGIVIKTAITAVINLLFDENMSFSTSAIPLVSEFERGVYSIAKTIRDDDFELTDLVAPLAELGLLTPIPIKRISNMASGVHDAIFDGDFAVGTHKMLGWGDATARRAFE